MSNKQTNARHIQILRTEEAGSIKLIEKSRRTVSKLRHQAVPHIVAENLVNELSQEIIRLRRGLINERTHRTRLANSLLPRLRSKAQEVRGLRVKLYGHEHKRRLREETLEIASDLTKLQAASLNGTH
jgi:hypothetical protein